MPGTFHIHDARGTRRAVPNGLAGMPPASRPQLKADLERARTLLWVRSRECRRFLRLGLTGALFVAAALATSWLDLSGSAQAVVLVACLIIFAAVLAMHRRIERGLEGWIERGDRGYPPICAACAYDLTALPPEPDGCTICPECGAAWRVGGAPA